jgi:hypothetical protein
VTKTDRRDQHSDREGHPQARRLTDAVAQSAIDASLADAKAAGTPIDGVGGLLNQMTKAVLERPLQTETTHHLGYGRDNPAGTGTEQGLVRPVTQRRSPLLRTGRTYRRRLGRGRSREVALTQRIAMKSIHDRPASIESRREIGHWEGDRATWKSHVMSGYTDWRARFGEGDSSSVEMDRPRPGVRHG